MSGVPFTVEDNGTVTSPAGFLAGAVRCGIKPTAPPDKLDLGIIASDRPCVAHACFTRNLVVGAPIRVSREHIRGGRARGIVFNSGNANTCTGEVGLAHAREMAERAAAIVGCSPTEMLVASTGVIGVMLPIERLREGFTRLRLTRDGGHDVAYSIMTTDTRPKETAVRLTIDGTVVTVGGVAKGSGMIHPDMATMFAFVTTDAALTHEYCRAALTSAVDRSFNMTTVDGDMSTSDMAVLLANGAAGNLPIEPGTSQAARFQEALDHVCVHLAREIARDGEGAECLIEVVVTGAADEADARRAARQVVRSNLVKAAVHGGDPNWGRILAALGMSGARFDPDRVVVDIGGIVVYRHGQPADFDPRAASAELKRPEVRVHADLAAGTASATAWGCDLTEAYVEINSHYTT